ncbi:MAG: succinylglutamate desuccinylase/aspartoacylase family protein [Deltaproteobacteria bacterium]
MGRQRSNVPHRLQHEHARLSHGVRSGPRLWLSGAVHGDELNGVMIVDELVQRLEPVSSRREPESPSARSPFTGVMFASRREGF